MNCFKCDGKRKVMIFEGIRQGQLVDCPRCGGTGVEPDGWKKPDEKPPKHGDYEVIVYDRERARDILLQAEWDADIKYWRFNDGGQLIILSPKAWRKLSKFPPWLNADGKEIK